MKANHLDKALEVYKTKEFQDALAYVSTLQAKGGKPVPADENGLDALVELKYAQ